MPALVREGWCRDGKPHISGGLIHQDNDTETQYSWCHICRQPLTRFWIDEEPGERVGRWSKWASNLYVIEEIDP
jgi:hypothetical protein